MSRIYRFKYDKSYISWHPSHAYICLHVHFHGTFLKMIAANVPVLDWILWWVWIDMVHGSEFSKPPGMVLKPSQ